jgi:hypothetical protein
MFHKLQIILLHVLSIQPKYNYKKNNYAHWIYEEFKSKGSELILVALINRKIQEQSLTNYTLIYIAPTLDHYQTCVSA